MRSNGLLFSRVNRASDGRKWDRKEGMTVPARVDSHARLVPDSIQKKEK